MGTGIVVCGLNGAGKTTLGKALAEKLDFYFIDVEELYFPKSDPDNPYVSSRTREEAAAILLREIKAHENFVFSAVKGDYGKEIESFFRYAVQIDVPKEIRVRRVIDRSLKQFGSRILPGGDLHKWEEQFLNLVSSRTEDAVQNWIKNLNCPVLRVDGTKTIDENTALILEQFRMNGKETP